MLSKEEETHLIKRAPHCVDAFHKLVISHLPLVHSIVRKTALSPNGMDDLVSEGVIALVNAIRKFNVHRGVRLSSYAKKWILFAVRKTQREEQTHWISLEETHESLISENQEASMVQQMDILLQRGKLDAFLSTLSSTEKYILEHRFLKEKADTYRSISNKLNYCPEYIRKIAESSKKKWIKYVKNYYHSQSI